MNSATQGLGGEPYEPVDRPRPGHVPPSGFSRPNDPNAEPGLTSFIPPFRAKRRRIARGATFVVVATVGTIGLRLALWTARVEVGDRPLGLLSFYFWLVCIVAGFFGLRKVWRWANAPDPADVRNPLMRGLPPLV
jgi:hypothetical protein